MPSLLMIHFQLDDEFIIPNGRGNSYRFGVMNPSFTKDNILLSQILCGVNLIKVEVKRLFGNNLTEVAEISGSSFAKSFSSKSPGKPGGTFLSTTQMVINHLGRSL